ncbi:MAG: U32 family peptidase, partial [Oscillospiraceae bacterium]|nr:U32 family peptidase [Oscillospiraceae bacterium]
GYGSFNARRGAVGFTREELFSACEYCRVRGVMVYAALNTLLSDRELEQGATLVGELTEAGVDAVLVQDLGVLRMVRMVAPDLPVHASTQMSIHSLDGVRQAHALGCARVVLARELAREQIAYICKASPIPVEVFVHGSLCLSHSGQCYMSAVVGERSGNRGMCAGPCRLPYGWEGRPADTYPLSLSDLSLLPHLLELRDMGVASIKIEGRMKPPAYVAAVTHVAATVLAENREPSEEEMRALVRVFSREGFTDGYYIHRQGPHMFGVRQPDPPGTSKPLPPGETAPEPQRVPVRFACLLTKGQPALLGAEDDRGRTATVRGLVPNPAYDHTLPEAMVNTQLYKTGGTPYRCVEARTEVEEGLSLPLSAINAMRREALDKLTALRRQPEKRPLNEYKAGLKHLTRKEPPALTIQVSRAAQLSPDLLALSPALIYLPLWELTEHRDILAPLLDKGVPFGAALPRVVGDHETRAVKDMLDKAVSMGVTDALVGSLGQFAMCRARDMTLRGDFGLNAFNAQALKTLKQMGLTSATLSFELNLAQIRDMSLCLDTELIVYGRLPLMLSENCLVKNRAGRCVCENVNELTDRTAASFPVLPTYGCRNVVYNCRKLFLADRAEDYRRIGLWGVRLLFTTENPRECVQVAERYLERGSYEPNGYTRGLYYRSV